ncbi:Transmembrane protein 8B [Eumeta japonica]|uniref:Transmembrane protein 8B n=1 Tax=Eumeta variegata TaxID=151549 RepID=A0A4C1TVI0_EUMVA|nr:Transmembrane protein 8B [Eumeta japonica]
MKICFCLLILYVCSVVTDDVQESEEEVLRRKILDQLVKTRTVLIDNYQLVTRQAATYVYMYRSYRTVSIIFYPVMRDVTDARFTFQAEELHLNNIGSCEPDDVIIQLKHGSYPAVNPDGYDFPKHFINSKEREVIYTIEFQSDGRNVTYSIENPKPGNWYALAYLKWEDPRTQKVEQQGLVARCQTVLYTDLQVKRDEESIKWVDCYSGITTEVPSTYKCIVRDGIASVSLNVTVLHKSDSHTNISIKIQALRLPTASDYMIHCKFDTRESDVQTIFFDPNPGAWHYVVIEPLTENRDNVTDCASYGVPSELDYVDNHTAHDLMRDDKGRFFTFDYGLPTTDLHDTTSVLNLTSDEIKTLRFNVNQFLDIGGNLLIETSLLMSWKYYAGYRRSVKNGNLLAFSEDDQYIRVVVCLNVGYASVPLSTGYCKFNDELKPALFVLNSTDSESIYDKVIIPYPDSGSWYLTFRLFCDNSICPCQTSDNGTKYYVLSDSVSTKKDVDTVEFSNDTRLGDSSCNATVVLSISSSACINGQCKNHGNCLLNTFGGLIMSFCSCDAGYGAPISPNTNGKHSYKQLGRHERRLLPIATQEVGNALVTPLTLRVSMGDGDHLPSGGWFAPRWDCSDDSRIDSMSYMLLSVLLLTLSNLLFLFSIYVAIIRLYYTEAIMYLFTMVLSTFYHACDAPAQVAYCIIRGSILQFGDFYCGIMSFWLTLLAMSIIQDKWRSFFQLVGAIVIALLTTWNMQSLAAFMLPVTVGVTIALLSWILDYKKYRYLKFPRTYYRRYLPLGIALVGIGLICYAFLQTEQNYKIVHSVWHMIIALSVVCLLPDAKRENANPFLWGPNSTCSIPFCKFFNRSQPQITDERE